VECGDGQIQGPVSQESGARAGFHALGAWDATGSPIASGIDTSITVAAAVEPRVRDTFLGSAIRCNAANHSNRRGRPIRYRDRCRVSRCDRAAQAPTARAARSADQIQRHARGVAKVPGVTGRRAITRGRSIAGRRVGNSRIATSRANVSIGSSRINRVRANTVPTVCAGICAGICAAVSAGCWFRKPERRRRYGVACG